MTRTTPTPHDAAFRASLSRLDTARDFLDIHLPPELRQRCDLSTLRLEPGSFIDDDLRGYCSDLLYSVSTDSGDGYIYCLVKHQSTLDRHMAFRLMRYAIAAMQQHLEAGNDRLPLVIPLMFYHGEQSPYPYGMNWLALFDDPALARSLYSGDFPLVDITVTPDSEIMTHRRVAALELLHKHIRLRDLLDIHPWLVPLLSPEYTDDRQLEILVEYMLQSGETHDHATLLKTMASALPEHGETLMTIAEQLRTEGRQEGRQEGQLETARNLILRTSMDDATIADLTGLDLSRIVNLRAELQA